MKSRANGVEREINKRMGKGLPGSHKRCPYCLQFMLCGDELPEERCCDICAGSVRGVRRMWPLYIVRSQKSGKVSYVRARNADKAADRFRVLADSKCVVLGVNP